MKLIALLTGVLSFAVAGAGSAHAQARYTATGPGSYVAAGVAFSDYQVDYGQRTLLGPTVYVDVHPTWRYGIEAEARFLRWHSDEDITQTHYMLGPKVYVWHTRRINAYGKFLVGSGQMNFPFNYGKGTYFAYAPGGGVEYRLTDYVSVRAVDFEYQSWPGFTFGNLHPYGISAGVTIRVTPMSLRPR